MGGQWPPASFKHSTRMLSQAIADEQLLPHTGRLLLDGGN